MEAKKCDCKNAISVSGNGAHKDTRKDDKEPESEEELKVVTEEVYYDNAPQESEEANENFRQAVIEAGTPVESGEDAEGLGDIDAFGDEVIAEGSEEKISDVEGSEDNTNDVEGSGSEVTDEGSEDNASNAEGSGSEVTDEGSEDNASNL